MYKPYVAADSALIADFSYQLDGVGNRQRVTETLQSPELVQTLDAFVEANGLLVMEAENSTVLTDTLGSHGWLTQTVQSSYGGAGYLRALPDVGDLHTTHDGPQLTYPFFIENPDSYTLWVRGMAPDASGDSVHVALNGQPAATADNLTGFTPNQWGWSKLTMSGGDAQLNLGSSSFYTLTLAMREDGLRIDRLLLTDDPNFTPSGLLDPESSFETITETVAPLNVHTIDYTYDDLYQLTKATYSGAISATYQYQYDAVGNMEAYTETVAVSGQQSAVSEVSRSFDDANRLQTAFDSVAGTTSYLYDDRGNLVEIIPPTQHSALRTRHSFDQRNLMITTTVYITGTGFVPQADYVYDGNGDRLQQVVYDENGLPSQTITYTNDVSVGLTNVLVADDGTETIYNIFGLALMAQDDGSEIRYLIVDALGSVRTEMVGNTIETVTTRGPYGNPLTQLGTSGTSYGFTGEQEDSTGFLYLRARYYNPSLRTFMSVDPFPGTQNSPASQHPYSYVHNNPINFVDLTGLCAGRPDDKNPCWRLANRLASLRLLLDYRTTLDQAPHYRPTWVGMRNVYGRRDYSELLVMWDQMVDELFTKKFIHTANYGTFDIAHSYPNNSIRAIDEVRIAVGRGNSFPLSNRILGGAATLKVTYRVEPHITHDQVYGVAFAIFKNFQTLWEVYQGLGPPGMTGSSFSVEDLPSEQLEFYLAKTMDEQGIPKSELNELRYDVLQNQLGPIVGIGTGPKIKVRGQELTIPVYTDGPCGPNNYRFMPLIYRGNQATNIMWPESMQMSSIPSSTGLWSVEKVTSTGPLTWDGRYYQMSYNN